MRRILLALGCLILTVSASANQTYTLFGPEVFKASQTKPKPTAEVRTFNVQGTYSKTEMDIVIGANMTGLIEERDARKGLGHLIKCLLSNLQAVLMHRDRPQSVEIVLNGKKILSENTGLFDFSFTKKVTLIASNRLEVLVKGQKNSYVTIRVRGEKINRPPVPVLTFTQNSQVKVAIRTKYL